MGMGSLACDAVAATKVMADSNQVPSLRPLHPDSALNAQKLGTMEKLSTDTLVTSLLPGTRACLKTRPDGTILDGHHRVYILRRRGVNVDGLPRDVVVKEQE
jgi:hypothetical protein